jgi:hypothetical protein
VASPLFDPKNRRVSPEQQGTGEVNRLHAKGKPFVVSIDSAPGIFLGASECVEHHKEFRLPRVPAEWKVRPPRVHLIGLSREHTVKTKNGHTLIDQIAKVNEAVRAAFLAIGCEVLDGAPSRFERKDVI